MNEFTCTECGKVFLTTLGFQLKCWDCRHNKSKSKDKTKLEEKSNG